MRPLPFVLALMAPLFLAGCGPSGSGAGTPAPTAASSTSNGAAGGAPVRPPDSAAATPVPRDPWLDDGRPQSGLPRMKLFLGARELDTELALTTQAIQKGMMWRTNVAETTAMLFVFGRPHQTAFWMKNVPMDIDVAYLDPEGTIREIHRLERQNTNPVPAQVDNIQFALETAEGWFQRNGISTGAVVRTEQGSLLETFFRR